MYDYIKGTITYVMPTAIVLDNNGIGYLLHVANPYSYASLLEKEATIYCYQAVREDAITLYGFKTADQKQLFLKLISVSGIGPKSALSILASEDSVGLISAIETDNVAYLTKFPGVGKKTAGQLVLDLKGKLNEFGQPEVVEISQVATVSPLLIEAKEALLGLGYSPKEIQKIMPNLEKEAFQSTSDVLSRAFKLLLGQK